VISGQTHADPYCLTSNPISAGDITDLQFLIILRHPRIGEGSR
jgi:hypothetical protein